MQSIKLVCFDLNKTLIKENSWYNLNLAMGITPEQDEKFSEEYRSGELGYEAWQAKLLEIYLKHSEANLPYITGVINKYSFREGAREIVSYLKARGYALALISGSMNLVVDLVAKELDIEMAEATNILTFDEAGRLKDLIPLGDDKQVKLDILKKFCAKLEISLEECVCVGDGDNDIELFRATGKGITFKGSPIEREAWKTVNSLGDLKQIL